MIPKIIHRIWLDDPMPEAFAAWGRRWVELHPGWEVRDWRDRLELPSLMLEGLFASLRKAFPKDWKRAEADLLRLELLHRYGGVYVDTDVEPLRSIEPLLEGRDVLVAWSANRGRGGERILTQAVLGSTPGHVFVAECLAQASSSLERYRGHPLAQVIGPYLVNRVWRRMVPRQRPTPLSEIYFYPQSIRDRDAGRAADTSRSYAWHHWNTTLRKKGQAFG